MFCGEHGTVDYCPECSAEDEQDYIEYLENIVLDQTNLTLQELKTHYERSKKSVQ